jgi:hypothetical protein
VTTIDEANSRIDFRDRVGLLIGAIYVVINYSLSRLAVALEARQRQAGLES